MNPYELGATLYVPANHRSLLEIAIGKKYPYVRSVVFCTEDAIKEADVRFAIDRLAEAVRRMERGSLRRFVRVRNPQVLKEIIGLPNIGAVDGFVLPKVDVSIIDEYLAVIPEGFNGKLMLTIETAAAFDLEQMARLRQRLMGPDIRNRILALRIGGNDLLQCLGLRRPRRGTIYSTPIGSVINQLVMIFRPLGFHLTGPVFEYLNEARYLKRETRLDLQHGLFGKTAIHPNQVPIIENEYRVSRRDVKAAERIVAAGAEAVFTWDGAMCEPATHRKWAESVLTRAQIYGVVDESISEIGRGRERGVGAHESNGILRDGKD
ncbi:MAG: HpcH/HpaI aldolase/citrate lyase family protein [Gemmataceae bacterium]|nr:HpcH/HpaI aldolase/citrate lyase family protein [Gemmataceae bacterium]